MMIIIILQGLGQRPVSVQNFNFLNLRICLNNWYDSLNGRSACTYTGQRNTEKRGHTSVPREGFETAIPVFERSNTARDLDSAATGASCFLPLLSEYFYLPTSHIKLSRLSHTKL